MKTRTAWRKLAAVIITLALVLGSFPAVHISEDGDVTLKAVYAVREVTAEGEEDAGGAVRFRFQEIRSGRLLSGKGQSVPGGEQHLRGLHAGRALKVLRQVPRHGLGEPVLLQGIP